MNSSSPVIRCFVCLWSSLRSSCTFLCVFQLSAFVGMWLWFCTHEERDLWMAMTAQNTEAFWECDWGLKVVYMYLVFLIVLLTLFVFLDGRLDLPDGSKQILFPKAVDHGWLDSWLLDRWTPVHWDDIGRGLKDNGAEKENLPSVTRLSCDHWSQVM